MARARRRRHRASSRSWAAMASQPMTPECVDGGMEGHRADHVGRAGLLPVRRRGPDDLVQPDQVDGAASGQKRVAGLEQRPRADRARPEPKGA